MTDAEFKRWTEFLGYEPCVVTWGASKTGTHACVRPRGHQGEHWSGCCNETVSNESLMGIPERNIAEALKRIEAEGK